MRKLLERINKALDNKGFSLVELIIVIAIMVALVAILAPQYLKYVERSRIAADETNLSNVLSAVQIAATDDGVVPVSDTVSISSAGVVTFAETGNAAWQTAVRSYLTGAFTLTSDTYSTGGASIVVTVTGTAGADDYSITFNPSWD